MESDPSEVSPRLPFIFNAHHALFFRRDFERREDTKELRDHKVLIIPMNKYDHGSRVKNNEKNGIHHDKDISPLSRNESNEVELPSENFVKIILALCDIIEPLRTSHVNRFINVRNELDALCLDESTDKETRKLAWEYASHFSRQLPYMMRNPLRGEEYWNWEYKPHQ